jgi:uncharacterized membrane protein YedE/YeeE
MGAAGLARYDSSFDGQRPSRWLVHRMNVDWSHFTPWASLAGGFAIALATALYLFGCGRIAGVSGLLASPLRALMAGGSLRPEVNRLLFVFGLLLAPWCWRLIAALPQPAVDVSSPGLIVAGLLVGVGVRMGNGCTSGHGVCGLSRLSLRSLVYVLAFMGAGFVTVFLLRHLM